MTPQELIEKVLERGHLISPRRIMDRSQVEQQLTIAPKLARALEVAVKALKVTEKDYFTHASLHGKIAGDALKQIEEIVK